MSCVQTLLSLSGDILRTQLHTSIPLVVLASTTTLSIPCHSPFPSQHNAVPRCAQADTIAPSPTLVRLKQHLVEDLRFSEPEATQVTQHPAVIHADRRVAHFDIRVRRAFQFHLGIEKNCKMEELKPIMLENIAGTIARAESLEYDLKGICNLLDLLFGIPEKQWNELLVALPGIISVQPLRAVSMLAWWRNLLVTAGMLEAGTCRGVLSEPGQQYVLYMLKTYPTFINHPVGRLKRQLKWIWSQQLAQSSPTPHGASSSSKAARHAAAKFKLAYMRDLAPVLLLFSVEGIQLAENRDIVFPWNDDSLRSGAEILQESSEA
jgi:hypothetical protein